MYGHPLHLQLPQPNSTLLESSTLCCNNLFFQFSNLPTQNFPHPTFCFPSFWPLQPQNVFVLPIGEEQEHNQGNLLPHDLRHRHPECPVCVRCGNWRHHCQQPPRMRPLLIGEATVLCFVAITCKFVGIYLTQLPTVTKDKSIGLTKDKSFCLTQLPTVTKDKSIYLFNPATYTVTKDKSIIRTLYTKYIIPINWHLIYMYVNRLVKLVIYFT